MFITTGTMLRSLLVLGLVALCQGSVVRSNARSPAGKIVGGQPIDIKQAPYQIALFEDGYFICGGSIVSASVILTAAHCAYGSRARDLQIRAGSTTYASGGSLHNVTSIYVHFLYDEDTIDYDLALLYISPAIQFDDTRQPITVANREPQLGENVTVSGWGTTTETGDVSRTLLATTIPIVDRNTCIKEYAPYDVTPRMFCAGIPGHDHCFGDSGGPLVRGNEIVGTVSWAIGCARAGYPGVDGNVANSELRAWLRETGGV